MILPLILAAIVCVDNGDGSWTCSGDSDYEGVTTNETGGTVCTNCVNMTPAECQSKKQALIDLGNQIQQLSDTLGYAFQSTIGFTYDQIDAYRSFTDFPWSMIYNQPYSDVSLDPVGFLVGVSSPTLQDYNNAISILFNAWHTSTNNSIVNVSFTTYTGSTANGARSFLNRRYNEISGLWHGSYMLAQSAISTLQAIYGDLLNEQSLNQQILFKSYDVVSRAESITCAPCQLSDGEGGGSGVQTGCLECYLVFLRRYQEQLDHLNDQTAATTNILNNILGSVNSGLGYLGSISNHVARIDDYLWTDQSNKLANVEQAIIVISNNIDSIQKYYYHTFSNASDISSGVYYDPGVGNPQDFEQVLNNVFNNPQGFDLDLYQKFSWFERVEMLLADIAGIASSTNPSSLSDQSIDQVTSAAQRFESLSDLPSQGAASIMSNGRSLQNLSSQISGLFPSQPSSIVLLEARYWIGDADLTLNVDSSIVQFSRVITGLIWTVVSAIVFWLILSRGWIVLVDVAKFFVNWFPKIFGN